jgi:hypothetical protein
VQHRALRSAVLAAAVTVLAAACSGQATSHVTAKSPTPRNVAGTHSSAAPAAGSLTNSPSPVADRPSTSPALISVPPPGGPHQTRIFPSARTRVFRAEMTDLWAAVVTSKPAFASQAFFPLAAYEQVKAISDPAADWHSRLMGDFQLDVRAAHQFLGRGARRATLLTVIVPSAEASWIDPGVCYNSVGYWHVAGARMVYRQNGQLRSIGIASLISWRGRWYVVHFGAVLRNGAYGVVDAPAAGPGVPGPPGGC